MSVFVLSDRIAFPPQNLAEENGLLAIGGDLSVERLIASYKMGIFPWYSEGDPILWWTPDPRLVLFPEELHTSKSLNKLIRKKKFNVTVDHDFENVIQSCADVHKEKDSDTWIVSEMVEAYLRLHHEGYAHSVETWLDDKLVGGVYGVSIGKCFFGESMFTRENNASKVAFTYLVKLLQAKSFELIDCQMTTDHLLSLGAREIRRNEFVKRLKRALKNTEPPAKWSLKLT